MRKISLNKNWSFYEADESLSFSFGKPASKTVNLPHDFIINKPRSKDAAGGPANGYFGAGQGVYTKELDVPADWEGQTVLLDIDGAYMNTEVALNGTLLGLHPYGYTPYQVELSPALRFDGHKNTLKIVTQSRQPSTRWYSGGGLYREVNLWVAGSVYLNPWDVFVSTPAADSARAAVHFEVTVTSREAADRPLRLKLEILDRKGGCVAEQARSLLVKAGGPTLLKADLAVENPNLWDLDSSYLYTYRVRLFDGGRELDAAEDTFGIRTISADAEHGFRLNGRTVKLKGGCIHHDNGFVGSCAYPKAEERKIRILQSVGYNAVRISHYPPSLAMLRACDRLGVLLLDECFDTWRLGKVPLDYHLYFEDWWERDIELMVRRDRNHPCVITYSIGNEIGERDGGSDGAEWAKKLADKFRSLDSTRLITSAICGIFDPDMDMSNFEANMLAAQSAWGEKTKGYAAPLDVVGYNYLNNIYEQTHEMFPDRVMMGTETHAFTTYDYWADVMKHPYVIGDFIWAAVDYLGEVGVGKVYWKKADETFNFMTPYPWRSSWQSDILLTGKRRPQSYYREIMWGHTDGTFLFTTHPKHYGDTFTGTNWHWHDVNDDWSFEDAYLGRPVKVDAYGPGDEAEFILNGRSLGRAPYRKLIATMDIPFERGTLEAVSYCGGKEISRAKLVTAGAPAAVALSPEEPTVKADLGDLCYVQVELRDQNGVRHPSDARKLTAQVTGPAEFIAIGSGSPCTEDPIGEDWCHAYRGAAVVILKASAPGEIGVKVTAEGGLAGSCTVTAVK